MYLGLNLITNNETHHKILYDYNVFINSMMNNGLMKKIANNIKCMRIFNNSMVIDILPKDINKFLKQQNDKIFITYNVALVFHILKYYSESTILTDLVDINHLRDVNLLYALTNMVKIDKVEYVPYTGHIINNYENLRMELTEYLLDYINDPRYILDNSIEKYGLGTEYIQIKGSIALLNISLNGMYVDRKHCASMHNKIKIKYKRVLETLYKHYKQMFKKYDIDDIDNIISVNESEVVKILQNEVQKIKNKHSIEIYYDASDHTYNFWKQYKQYSHFVSLWLKYKKYRRYYGILSRIYKYKDIVHPIYSPLTVNGKTTCKNPPIQQFPTKPGYREIFTAHPGNIIMGIDYNYIELCTLARICEHKFGKSVLADNIRNNIDLHTYTATMLFGDKYSQYNRNDKVFQEKRKIAKTINLSVSGGQGAKGLQKYAKRVANIDLSLKEAREFRKKLIYDIYPELGRLLDDYTITNMAKALNQTKENCKNLFGKDVYRIKTVLTEKMDTKEYFVLINKIKSHCKNPETFKYIEGGQSDLYKILCCSDICTLTGRLRKKVDYTVAFNMPRSALAADLAKLALWNLTKKEYKIIAFIHDEVLVELPKDSNVNRNMQMIREIFENSMPDLSDFIPIRSKSELMNSWKK